MGIKCRLIGNKKPAIWESGGPAHHRINAENAYFYRNNANSKIAVTQEVTQTLSASICLNQTREGQAGAACCRHGRRSTYRFQDFHGKVLACIKRPLSL